MGLQRIYKGMEKFKRIYKGLQRLYKGIQGFTVYLLTFSEI